MWCHCCHCFGSFCLSFADILITTRIHVGIRYFGHLFGLMSGLGAVSREDCLSIVNELSLVVVCGYAYRIDVSMFGEDTLVVSLAWHRYQELLAAKIVIQFVAGELDCWYLGRFSWEEPSKDELNE